MASLKKRRKPMTLKVTEFTNEGKTVFTRPYSTRPYNATPDTASSEFEKKPSAHILVNEHLDDTLIHPQPELIQATSNPSASKYAIRKEKLVGDWGAILPRLLEITRERQAFPDTKCCLCDDVAATVRCTDCGPQTFYCCCCSMKIHAFVVFHKPQIWKESHYGPCDMTPPICSIHKCDSQYLRCVTIYDALGRKHDAKLHCCACEPVWSTLWRHALWPSSPINPNTAIYQPLLQQYYAYHMQGHVSLHANCMTSTVYNNTSFFNADALYRILLKESWTHYLDFYHRGVRLRDIVPNLDDGTSCPACPVPGEMVTPTIISADANFGLVRRKAAGLSTDDPKTEGTFFLPQQQIDDQVNKAINDKNVNNDCNDFQAGSALRAKMKSQKLDETGVFGTACRHEHPYVFCSIRGGGEKLCYSVTMLETVIENLGSDNPIIFMYDIACMLQAHLKNAGRLEEMKNVLFSVPIFHNYGHKMSCQLMFSPRRIQGIGLTDGECMERLWAYLRRFKSITKEQSSENRVDHLTYALLYHSSRVREKMGATLVHKLQKAVDIQKTSNDQLQILLRECSLTEEAVRHSMVKEKELILNPTKDVSDVLNWREIYAKALHEKDLIIRASEQETKKCDRITHKLSKMEKIHKIQTRWSSNDQLFKDHLSSAIDKERLTLLKTLQRYSIERKFFLTLIKKYADGQAIAIRLQRQMNLQVKQIKKAVLDYNSMAAANTISIMPINVVYEDVLDVSNGLWSELEPVLDVSVNREVVELLNLRDRAYEEINLVKCEMLRVLDWHEKQLNLLHGKIIDINTINNEPYNIGARAQVIEKAIMLDEFIHTLRFCFNNFIDMPPHSAVVCSWHDGTLDTILTDIDGIMLSEFECDDVSDDEI